MTEQDTLDDNFITRSPLGDDTEVSCSTGGITWLYYEDSIVPMTPREVDAFCLWWKVNENRIKKSYSLRPYTSLVYPKVQIAPLCIIDDDVEIGEGTKVWHFTHICSGARIGKNCVLGQGCYVGPNVVIGNGCRIQNGVSIFEGVTLGNWVFVGPNATFTNVKFPRAIVKAKKFDKTFVDDGATIGANATIICPCNIGDGAIVGAGAVVTKDVGAGETVVGNPARLLGHPVPLASP